MYHIHDHDRNTERTSPPHACTFVLILSVLAVLLSTVFAPGIFAQSATTTFTPTTIPLSAPEIANPGRGLHRWNGMEMIPVPMRDSYRRQHWSELETARGVYDFSAYDAEVKRAAQRGRRLIIGLPQPTGATTNQGSWMPADLTNPTLGAMDRGSYHPNFNDPVVLNRWKALIDAIAQRYANDGRVSGIQLCIVGAYGEWYFSPTVPEWVRPSEATTHTMIDEVIAKFPSKQLYMLISSTMPQATIYALQRSPRMGLARMALGDPQFDRTWNAYGAHNPAWVQLLNERWKTAPLMTETLRSGDTAQFARIIDQVQRYHVSTVGNGNFDPPLASTAGWSDQDTTAFERAGKLSGYRYVLQSLQLSPLAPGHAFTATSAWTNVGVTPVYEPWQVHVQLRTAGNVVVFDSASALDLQTVLPTNGTPVTHADTGALPNTIAPGSYRVHVFIPPLNTYVPALQLAIAGQQDDGSYDLGTVVVTQGASAPAGVPTTTATPVATSSVPPTPTTSPTANPQQQTITFAPDADARVTAAEPDKNYGRGQTLRVDNGPDPEIQSYLRFMVHDLPSTVLRATLRIYATSHSTAGAAVYGTSPTWTENTITWNNRPHPTTPVGGQAAVVATDTWVSYDITRLVTGNGPVSLVLIARSMDGMNFASRETSHPPQLLVTVRSTTPTAIGPTVATPTSTHPAVTATPSTHPSTTATAPVGATATSAPQPPSNANDGLWISRAGLRALPQSGAEWQRMKAAADGSLGTPNLADLNSTHDTATLAVALVYGATNDASYRVKAASAILSAIGTEDGGRTLELARNLVSYIIAADIIDLHSYDPAGDARFRTWLAQVRYKTLNGQTLISTHETRPNNWGTHAGASRVAADVYLGDTADLARAAEVFEGWLGNRSRYAGFTYGDTSWQCDGNQPVGVNGPCVRDGHNLDGALPDDMRRGSSYHWPPTATGYAWEAMQGATVQAELLERAGYSAWQWQNKALLRAAQFLQRLDQERGGWWATGDDSWQPWLINHAYGTAFPTTPANPGKNMAWTDWMYGSH